MQKHMAYPMCRMEYIISRICVEGAGGSKPKNGTYELLVISQHKCYENDRQTLKDANILPSIACIWLSYVWSSKYNLQLTQSLGRPNKRPLVVLMKLLQVNKVSQVNQTHISGTLVQKMDMSTKYNIYALNTHVMCCITYSSSPATCSATYKCCVQSLSRN